MVSHREINALLAGARRCLEGPLSPSEIGRLARQITGLDDLVSFKQVRVALLGTTTIDFIAPALSVAAFADRILVRTWVAPFDQIDQQTLDPTSSLYEFCPEMVFIHMRAEDMAPDLLRNLDSVSDAEIDNLLGAVRERIDSWCRALHANGPVQIVLSSFVRPAWAPLGVRDFLHPRGQRRVWHRLNADLAAAARQNQGVVVLDMDSVVRRVGQIAWEDPKLWYLAKIAGGAKNVLAITDELMPLVREATGRRRKCLVLDLDNTLWGGIIGEDGLAGIKLGGGFPGNVFRDFQTSILDVWHQGVILAINSKNNAADAEAVFAQHPEMVLKLEHFAVRRINWADKVENLRGIAQSLNIGFDSLVFVEDSPVECDRVRAMLPEVTVMQIPKNIADLPRMFMAWARLFDGTTLSDEDKLRNDWYRQNVRRQNEFSKAASVDDFLRSLEMVAEISAVWPANLARTVQLLHKTNQFNLTTRRHSEGAVAALAQAPDWKTYAVRLKDKYGDNGLIALALVRLDRSKAVIDTLLMSCRVIGRDLEHALIDCIADDVRNLGIIELIGEYVPSAKNGVVEDLYEKLGFLPIRSDTGRRLYRKMTMPEYQAASKGYIMVVRG